MIYFVDFGTAVPMYGQRMLCDFCALRNLGSKLEILEILRILGVEVVEVDLKLRTDIGG